MFYKLIKEKRPYKMYEAKEIPLLEIGCDISIVIEC